MDPLINPEKVERILKRCFFRGEELKGLNAGETPKDAIVVEGILNKFGFNKERIELSRKEISEMLDQLPDQFYEDTGGGWTFLNMVNDKNGEQWTSYHKVMDELMVLGMAINRIKYLLPRSAWGALPGGMPYFVISPRGTQEFQKKDSQLKEEEIIDGRN